MNNKFFIICLAVIFFTLVTKAQWQQTNGPYGGPISCFVFSGNNIFAGSPYGGVFFSADNGNSWISVNNGLTDIQITSLVVIGTNIFAGTSSSGVFLSTNDGGIWIPVNTGMTGYDLMITCLAINGTTIFAGTYNGIFSSSNSGESWIKKSYITSVRSILVSGTNIFAANYNGVYLSTNNGTSWTLKNTGLTSHNISCLALSGSNIFAGTSNPAAGVFLSTNNGAS